MKRILLSAAALTLILTFAFAATSRQIQAQEDEEMMLHVCDSTLITLLFIAEYDYGFESMLDISTFDKGQFQPLFDTMMMMDDEMMDEDMGDDMEGEEEMMDDEEMGDDMMMEGMTMLTPGHVADEDPACTELRNELDAFFYDEMTHAMMMGDDMMDDEG